MKLYVVRHGETMMNVLKLVNGHNEIGLNIKGKMQASRAAQAMEKEHVDLVFCSPLKRTKQTCNIINSKNIDVIYEPRLKERNARSKQFTSENNIVMSEWYDINKDVLYKDTEGFKSVCSRISEFLKELENKYPDKSILLVTHGDVCKAIYTYYFKLKDAIEISEFNQANCEIKKYTLE